MDHLLVLSYSFRRNSRHTTYPRQFVRAAFLISHPSIAAFASFIASAPIFSSSLKPCALSNRERHERQPAIAHTPLEFYTPGADSALCHATLSLHMFWHRLSSLQHTFSLRTTGGSTWHSSYATGLRWSIPGVGRSTPAAAPSSGRPSHGVRDLYVVHWSAVLRALAAARCGSWQLYLHPSPNARSIDVAAR